MSSRTSLTVARLIRGSVIFCWIAAYAWLLPENRYRSFLAAEFKYMILGGMVILSLLIIPVVFVRRSSQTHDHAGARIWIHAVMLLLPLVYLSQAQGRVLGKVAYENRVVRHGRKLTVAPTASKSPRPVVTDKQEVTLPQIWQYYDDYQGKTVIVDGIVYTDDETVPPGHFILYRFSMVCCAADVRPVEIMVQSDASLEIDTWVRVEGQLKQQKIGEFDMPTVTAVRVTGIERPDEPYLSY